MLVYQRVPGLVNIQKAIGNGHRNRLIVDLAIKTYVIFHGFLYVYQRVPCFFQRESLGIVWTGEFFSVSLAKNQTRGSTKTSILSQDFDLPGPVRACLQSQALEG